MHGLHDLALTRARVHRHHPDGDTMACWSAEASPMLEDPPPGPYLALPDAREGHCQRCGIRDGGTILDGSIPWPRGIAASVCTNNHATARADLAAHAGLRSRSHQRVNNP